MIKHIDIRAVFTTGHTLTVKFQPQSGITAVVGPNGSGKTFTASEALRYLLYGSSALRGKMSDFTRLDVRGVVEIRGREYRIERTSKALFLEDVATKEKLAVGADAVNKKSAELLGYKLDVFDVCNASVQGNTALFGKMRPAERKSMIDQILGVMDVQAVEKACKDEASALRRECDVLSRGLRDPGNEFIIPANYRGSNELLQKLSEGRGLRKKQRELQEKIKPLTTIVHVEAPTQDIEALRRHEIERVNNEARRRELMAIADRRPDIGLDQIDASVAAYNWDFEDNRRGPKPTISMSEALDGVSRWNSIRMISEITDQTAVCPKCACVFQTRPDMPETPDRSLDELNWQVSANEAWKNPMPPKPKSVPVMYPESVAAEFRLRHLEADKAEKAMQSIPILDLRAEELSDAYAKQAAYSQYLQSVEANRKIEASNAEVVDELVQLGYVPSDEEIDAISDELRESESCERRRALWVAENEAFNKLTAEISEKLARAQHFKEGATGLADARATLKAYLAPTLSKVASNLIFDMTNGKLSSIFVDEDMDISVDGQRLETLSGAGATVANIALRIGLGQVLVGKAFPVFIGDEMDGDLDYERREATIQAMVSLKSQLRQIILITHRGVDVADHVIDLGDNL